jgi:hypothetical protein
MHNVTFTKDPEGRPIYYINLEIDNTILEELKEENWVPITATHLDDMYTKRHRINGSPKGKLVASVMNYFLSPEFKETMVDLVWKDKMFQHKWGPRLSIEKIKKMTTVEYGYDMDVPGFSTDLHVENRCQIAFGKIFFTEEDNENISSYFYETKFRESGLRMPTGMGIGWLCINSENGWHEGWNKGTEKRYSSSLNFAFDIFNDGHVTADDATIKYTRGESEEI